MSLYLFALGLPFAWEVFLAAKPGHVAEPFGWPMVLPWLADVLTGIVYYFAGMLAAYREARWYGSRCLGLAAAIFCSILVWSLPEFWQALLAVVLIGGSVALAAWGSFLSGGAYAPQPRLAKIALALTFLMGLTFLSLAAKFAIGVWTWDKSAYAFEVDRHGQVLLFHEENNKLQSITDLEGHVPQELESETLDYYTYKETVAPCARVGFPKTRSYRNSNRYLIKYGNATKPGNEDWWYVPAKGRLYGYDKHSKRLIGSFGPDGFSPPDGHPSDQFQGELTHLSAQYLSRANDYLAFPGAVYTIDFRKRKIETVFIPAAGETVLWASRWRNDNEKLSLAFVGTDKSIHVLDESGARLVSAPRAYDRNDYQVTFVGRLSDPPRYWFWYDPAWYAELSTLETKPAYLVMYDAAGREILPRQGVRPLPGAARNIAPHIPLVQPSSFHSWFGTLTPPAEAAVLVGTKRYLESEARSANGTEMWLLLPFVISITQFFIPGVRWQPASHGGLVFGFSASMLLSAIIAALVCFLLARRYVFSRAQCLGWALVGHLGGPVGLLVMLALQDWPARLACPNCGRLRVVTRDRCEHCGAPHCQPAPDGTEIFETAPTDPLLAVTGSV